MEDPATNLETKIELEKLEIPVPEKTMEAAVKHARSVARRLRASKTKTLSTEQIKALSNIAKKLKAAIINTGAIPKEDEDSFNMELSANTQKCADEFECFGEECQEAADQISENKVEASEKLIKLAKNMLATNRPVSPVKLKACVKRIIADVTKKDLLRNLVNIENKSQKDQTLQTMINWNDVSRLSPNVTKSTQLKNLKVQDLKNILVCVRGGTGAKDEE